MICSGAWAKLDYAELILWLNRDVNRATYQKLFAPAGFGNNYSPTRHSSI
jgi:hypothetical protein